MPLLIVAMLSAMAGHILAICANAGRALSLLDGWMLGTVIRGGGRRVGYRTLTV